MSQSATCGERVRTAKLLEKRKTGRSSPPLTTNLPLVGRCEILSSKLRRPGDYSVSSSAGGSHEMPECWVCSNPAEGHFASTDSTSVGVCWRCSIFGCNTHTDFDGDASLLFCSLCVAEGDSSPPTEDPHGGPGGGGPGQRQRRPGDSGLSFASVRNAMSRFPRLHQMSAAHADAIRYRVPEMIALSASKWPELFGERINLQEVDEDLIALGIGMTLWSAELGMGELPSLSGANLKWMVRNPILRIYISELEIA
jgi:hypothetical protein